MDTVLISDVRDKTFQDDPFLSSPFGSQYFLEPNYDLLLFSEGLNDISIKGNATLRNTRGNFRWLMNIYGEEKARLLGENAVLHNVVVQQLEPRQECNITRELYCMRVFNA